MSRAWVKLWVDALSDPKLALLSDRLYRRFIECLLLGGKYDTSNQGELPAIHILAWELRVDQDELEGELQQLEAKGLLETEEGQVYITNWQKRQRAMTNAERQARYRKSNVGSNEPVTKPTGESESESDIEIDKESDIEEEEEGAVTPATRLLLAFHNETQIPFKSREAKRNEDIETATAWHTAGYTEQEVVETVRQMQDKGLTIARPESITNGLAITRSRNRGRPRVGMFEGEFSDVIEH